MFGFSLLPGWLVDGVRRVRGALIVQARSRRSSGRCPACRCSSARVHGYHRRRPADLPIMRRPVVLDLRIRRYACTNAACHRRTFSEAVPALVAPHARCTRRLIRAQTRIGVALGGEAGRRLTRHLAMAVSGDTLLRLVRAAPARATETPAIIGVDDPPSKQWTPLLASLWGRKVSDDEDATDLHGRVQAGGGRPARGQRPTADAGGRRARHPALDAAHLARRRRTRRHAAHGHRDHPTRAVAGRAGRRDRTAQA